MTDGLTNCVSELQRMGQQLSAVTVERDALRKKTECSMGVGDGSGQLFVHGDYNSIKAAQALFLDRDRNQLIADKEHLAREYVTARADFAKLHAENERMREIVDLLMNCGEPEPLMLPGVKICHTWRWTHEVDGRTWTRPAEGENQGVHPRVEELLKEVDRAALASPTLTAPKESDDA